MKRKMSILLSGLLIISMASACSKSEVQVEPAQAVMTTKSQTDDPKKSASETSTPIQNETYKYTFKPCVVWEDCTERYGKEYISFMEGVIDAYLNYKTSAPCPNKEFVDDFCDTIDGIFPLFHADACFDFENDYNEKSKTIEWSYSSKSKKEHDKIVNEFKELVASKMQCLQAGDTDFEKVVALYQEFTTTAKFDYDFINPSKSDGRTYRVFKDGIGICQGLSRAFAYLVNQAGVNADVVIGFNQKDGHSWNIIKIEGESYLFDPTFELSRENKKARALNYFGMSQKARESKYGSNFTLKQSRYGLGNGLDATKYVKVTHDFDFFQETTDFTLDRKSGQIRYHRKGEEKERTYQYKEVKK